MNERPRSRLDRDRPACRLFLLPRAARVLGPLAACAALWAAPWAAPAPRAARAEEPAARRILLVATPPSHGQGEHEYLQGARILAALLGRIPGVEAAAWNGFPPAEELEKASALHLFTSYGGDFLLRDPERREEFLRCIRRGVGFSTLHFACDISEDLEGDGSAMTYLGCLGAFYDTGYSRNPINDVLLRPANVGHPILKGFAALEANDEVYYRLRFMPFAEPLLVARMKDADGDFDRWVLWIYSRPDGGRSFGYTGGHFHRVFRLEGMRRVLVQGIHWTAGGQPPEGELDLSVDPVWLEAPPRAAPAASPPPGRLPSLYRRRGDDARWASLIDDAALGTWIRKGEASWTLEGGVLKGTGAKGYLYSPRSDYRDFELRAEARLAPGSNSGLLFRIAEPVARRPDGFEAQLNNSSADPVRTGSLFKLADVAEALVADEDWFRIHVIADGPRILILVNGAATVDVDVRGAGGSERAAGHIAIQQHTDGGVVELRNLQLLELKAPDE